MLCDMLDVTLLNMLDLGTICQTLYCDMFNDMLCDNA